MPKSVGAFEAKTHFAALLDRAAAGETVVITKHGRPVARLVPAEDRPDKARVRDAIARLEAFAERHSLGGLDWRVLRDEGRS
jgi:prevent-host-death family protein